MIAARDAFVPWRTDHDRTERVARLRIMRAICRPNIGPRGYAFAGSLRLAEIDDTQLEHDLRQLDALAPLDRRTVFVNFAALRRGGR